MSWKFKPNDSDQEWYWECVDDATSEVIKRSDTAFFTLIACAYDAVAHGYVPPPDRIASNLRA